jgi:four helix bundle protein
MRDHIKLRAFELADPLAISVYHATSAFPREEGFGLTAQLRRGAVSVASNIVEGCARSSEAEYLHFLDIAYGSAREVEYPIGLAHRLGFLPDSAHGELGARSTETGGLCWPEARIRPFRPLSERLQGEDSARGGLRGPPRAESSFPPGI